MLEGSFLILSLSSLTIVAVIANSSLLIYLVNGTLKQEDRKSVV